MDYSLEHIPGGGGEMELTTVSVTAISIVNANQAREYWETLQNYFILLLEGIDNEKSSLHILHSCG